MRRQAGFFCAKLPVKFYMLYFLRARASSAVSQDIRFKDQFMSFLCSEKSEHIRFKEVYWNFNKLP